jgi:uncharacterized protein YqgQ
MHITRYRYTNKSCKRKTATTHIGVCTYNKWTTPKDGTIFKKALKTKNFMKRNFNKIFKDKIINKLFYKNNPSVCQRKTKQNSVAKIITNTL